MTGGHRNQEGW
jgi:hypothetical protein